MVDSGGVSRLGHMKALLGVLAGAGASYGIYKLVTGEVFQRKQKGGRPPGCSVQDQVQGTVHPGSLLAKLSGLDVVRTKAAVLQDVQEEIDSKSAETLQPENIKMLLWCLQTCSEQTDRCRVLVTLGNAAAFSAHQDAVRELGGLTLIARYLSDPAADVRVQTLNALNNLSMNVKNQDVLKAYIPQVLELIETSPVNSNLQLAALRLLTNLSAADVCHHLLRDSIRLLLSLLVVSGQVLQIQTLKVLVNLSSNPDMMDDIVQATVPASVVLLFDLQTAPAVLQRLLAFTVNLKAWTPSSPVAAELHSRQDCLYRVLLDPSSTLHSRLVQLLSHPDQDVRAHVAHVLL